MMKSTRTQNPRQNYFFLVEMYENLLKDVWPNFDDKFGAKI